MYFQVNISPAHKTKPVEKDQPEEIPILSLAPFTAIPKICFDNVLINTQTSKMLIIHNTTPNNTKLYITRAPPEERCFSLSWVECTLSAQEKIALELFWNATCEGGWKDTITFEDGARIKKDVSVVFKCVKPKKTKVKPKKVVKCVSTKVKSPKKWFSPKQKSPKVIAARSVLPDITNVPRILVESPRKNMICNENTYIKNKENLEISEIENLSFAAGNSEFTNKMTSKNPFIIRDDNSNGSEKNFDDSLEMIDERIKGRATTFDDRATFYETPMSIKDKLNVLVFTPTRNPFQSTPCWTGEKTLLPSKGETLNISISSTATYDVIERSPQLNLSSQTYVKCPGPSQESINISSATYNIVKNSPECSMEERLSNISSGTFVRANISSSTYTKEGILAELNFSDRSLSPIQCETDKNEFCYQFQANRPLEQILEESTVSSDFSQLNRTEFRKRRSETCLSVVSPKRRLQNPNVEEQSFRSGAVKKNFKPVKGLDLKEKMSRTNWTNRSLVTVLEVPAESNTTVITRQTQHDTSFTVHNPFILTAIDSIDPFISGALYYDTKWVDEQQNSFKKWLNALLTPPTELNSNTEATQLDVVKLWQDCKKREVSKAPTRETISNKYHTKTRLDSLRRNAGIFFRSKQINEVLSKISMMIENQRLAIRDDRNIHLDLGLQAEILTLFLSYNPLWLRIGLETIYNTAISLHSNSDVVGMILFLSEHFFKDQYLLKKFKSVHSKKYASEIKKLVLKKFLMLVFFLDQAKETKLIPHDPCLFCKNAPYKESRNIILKFSCELLSSIGDITRVIRPTGYILKHKQDYIHEFDYAVNNLGVDLRDGVRLTRVMEIILTVEGLTTKMRVPAISRLQKIHNMKVVFDALNKSGHTIMQDIEPKDIVDGHKEKTLSFLWQIIYKFQAPRITKAVLTIQQFWRSLHITIARRILIKERRRRELAAIKIQRWYRRVKLSKKLIAIIPAVTEILHRLKTEKAATIIQSNLQMMVQRKRYITLRKGIIKMQSYSRRFLVTRHIRAKIRAIVRIQTYFRMNMQRKQFLGLKAAVRSVEENYISKKLMQNQFEAYRKLKSATLFIQARFKAKLSMRKDLEAYTLLRSATILIQTKFRANKLMQKRRYDYLTLKTTTILLQQTFRANKEMKLQQSYYQRLKSATILIQGYFRAKKQMRIEENKYKKLKQAVLVVQNHFRAKRLMLIAKKRYQQLKSSTILIQQKYRAKNLMLQQRKYYQNLKTATLVIQQQFRAKNLMLKQRNSFQILKRATVMIQERFRANRLMKKHRNEYLRLKNAAQYIQSKYRAKLAMRTQTSLFIQLKGATVILQRKFRANKLMQKRRYDYLTLKTTTILLQQTFRANKEMKLQQIYYQRLKSATILIQRYFRAKKRMGIEENKYKKLKQAVLVVQNRFRAKRLMLIAKKRYQQLKSSTILIQQKYRAKNLMLQQRKYYQNLKTATLVIQQQFRAKNLMLKQRNSFQILKRATVMIQERFRANRLMRKHRNEYLKLKNAAQYIQSKYRAKLAMRTQTSLFIQLKGATVILQRKFRANKLMLTQKARYQDLKEATIIIQRRYRAEKLGSIARKSYLHLKSSVRTIENRFLATKLMKQQRQTYLKMKNSVRIIEERYAVKKLAIEQRESFLKQKRAAVLMQRKFRAQKQMKIDEFRYKRLRNATVMMQRRFRANRLCKQQRYNYQQIRKSCVAIQNRFRANQKMKIVQNQFLVLRKAAIIIQERFRANALCRECRQRYLSLKVAVKYVENKFKAKKLARRQLAEYSKAKQASVIIQRSFRGYILMKKLRQAYLLQKRSAVVIQNKFRAHQMAKTQQIRYQQLRKSTIVIQRKFRANKLMMAIRHDFIELRNKSISIQRWFRAISLGSKQRRAYLELKNAARTVQQRFRARKLYLQQYNEYVTLKRYTLMVQMKFRANRAMKIQRDSYLRFRDAAILVQRRFRTNNLAKEQRGRYLTLIKSVVFIQLLWRAKRTAKKTKANVIIVQAFVRGFLARKMFDQQYLPILIERRERREIERRSATKIQACWRGYKTRSIEEPELGKIREKVKAANERVVPEKTLAYRKEKAMGIMVSEDSTLDQIISALQALDYETRLFEKSCIDLSQCLPEELYRMITTSSRSVPEMHSCTAATSILINFCKHPSTIDNCWHPQYMDDVFTIMMHWCDKDYPLFAHLCTLIWHLAADPRRKRYIANIPNVATKLQKIKHQCERKHKMAGKTQYKGANPNIFGTYRHLPTPSLGPLWGLEYQKNPRTFKNAVHAMHCLLTLFNIKCY